MADINVLVVADGIFNFGPQIVAAPPMGNPDERDVYFTISQFISILSNSQSPTISVSTAHRRGDPNATITTAFNFHTTMPDLSIYDVIWLFGDEGTNNNIEMPGPPPGNLVFIGTDEIAAIAEFMNGGGGVFATGDHEGLGSIMCGLIPRVRSMRAWFSDVDTDPNIPAAAPRSWPGTGPGRADTVQPASDNTWHFDNQSDDIPQPLKFPSGTSHPILQGAHGPLSSFPDHMHEGQVILPWSYTDPLIPGDPRAEYPTVAGYQEKPIILATGQTIGNHPTPTEGSACEQSNFFNETKNTQQPGFTINTLGAYDGHTVGVGRVVTDSSFHHYLDLNLIGDPCAPPGAKQQGFTTAPGAPMMADLTAFYINTVAWLARQVKSCSLLIQNSTFGKDQIVSIGLPATFPSAFWVVMEGFLPSELGVDAQGNLTNPANPPAVSFSIDPPASANAAVVTALQNHHQFELEAFSGKVLTESLPPQPNSPQRFLYPFTIKLTGIDGFVLASELLTLTAAITVGGKPYQAAAKLVLTTAANPYVTDEDAGNDYTSWLSTDLRVFKVDDDEPFFGAQVSDYYPPGQTGPVSAAAASKAATGYITDVIKKLTASTNGQAGSDTFDGSLSELEDATRSQLEFLQIDPRTGKPAFNFAICRVRIRGTTPTGPGTTQAINCRVFFRAFQAQTTASSFNTATTYRETPIVANYGRRVPLLGVQNDATGQAEYVTLPFFAVDRINLAGPADLTTQPADVPNRQTISPASGEEVDTYYGCWLDMNQPTLLFPQFAPPNDWDNQHGSFNTTGFAIQSINGAFNKAPHQCLIAEIAFDDLRIPPGADTSTSDKLAQRNLAYIDGPNPGAIASRRMPHPFQIQASSRTAQHVDELMIAWGDTPAGSTASLYLPGVAAADILALAEGLYSDQHLTIDDANTIEVPVGPITFVPIPKSYGLLAGLLTVNLPPGVVRGDVYTIVVRQVTDAGTVAVTGRGDTGGRIAGNQAVLAKQGGAAPISWRRVLGAFQINIPISTKEQLLVPEEHRLALFRWITEGILPRNRWYPVMQRYIEQLAGRVTGFGGDPGKILPSPTGYVPGLPSPHGHGHEGDEGSHHREVSGKVNGIVYDHFGDFEGFIIETSRGESRRFHSREQRVLKLVRKALEERIRTTVIRERDDMPLSIILTAP
jgi:hypothetical protein